MRHHVFLLLPAFALALACCATAPALPRDQASIAGRIAAVNRVDERIGVILVEGDPAENGGSRKAVVRVTQATAILTPGPARAEFGALRVGQSVRVWFSGPARQSYPVQAAAATIVVDSARPAR